MILMNALPDSEFMFMKESMYAKDLKVAFPQFAVVLQEMQNYDLNKKKTTPKQEATVPHTTPSQLKVILSKPFDSCPTSRELPSSDLLGLRKKDLSSLFPVTRLLLSIPSLAAASFPSSSASAPTTLHSTSS